jgi:hypothetical protein
MSPKAAKSLDDLRRLKAGIDAIKNAEYQSAADRLAAEVQTVRERGGGEYAQLAQRLLPLLTQPGA